MKSLLNHTPSSHVFLISYEDYVLHGQRVERRCGGGGAYGLGIRAGNIRVLGLNLNLIFLGKVQPTPDGEGWGLEWIV